MNRVFYFLVALDRVWFVEQQQCQNDVKHLLWLRLLLAFFYETWVCSELDRVVDSHFAQTEIFVL